VFGKIQRRGPREIRTKGWSYAAIARKLGYQDARAAWHAAQLSSAQRLRDQEAAWRNHEERTGHPPQTRQQPTETERELEQAIATIATIAQQLEAIEAMRRLTMGDGRSAKSACCARRLSRCGRRETRAK